ncbi:MAG: hypothetical protein CMB62_00005, partial [Euryarchaeota archaeon]|nr:hypothetical protein [Euryarchaeota archaeon]
MSDMSKPEMTAQVLVAVGAVFLLISAYVMGVYIPNQKELSDDFESRTSFDGDMTLFDQTKSATLQGDYNAENSLISYPASAGTNAEIVATADPSKSDDEKTYYVFNASAFSSAEKTDENWILTFSETNNYVDRTTYESKNADDADAEFAYTTWSPNDLPEAKDTQYPNPFVSTHTNNYVYEGEETVGGIDCYKYSADETFAYSSESVLALKAAFDGFLPEGLAGTSAGEMQYKEVIWVGKETGQVADRSLDIVVNFIPDPRLAINFQATEALDSTIQYEGTLDELDITADRRTFSSGSVFAGVDNATGAERTYMNATGTLFVSGETEPRVNTTFLIDTHTQQAQGQAPDGTYISGGTTFFGIGAGCDTTGNTTHTYMNLFLTTHPNTYVCVESTAIPGFIIPSAGIMGTTNVNHYRSVETDVPYDTTVASLPVYDPVNGYCMNPAACPDRQWAPLIAFALTQTALGDSALQIPIRSDSTMTLPRFTDNVSMVVNQQAIFGSQYHPLIQMSFTAIDEYATALGLENVSYMNMPFVLDPEGSRSLPVPGNLDCDMGVTCVMGSEFTHPLVAGVMNATMTQLSGNGDAYKEMPWYIGESAVLPVPGDLGCAMSGVCTMGYALHPLIREQLASTAAYGLDPVNTPWVTTNMTSGDPLVMMLPNMTEDFSAYYYMQPDMSYSLDINTALLGNQTNMADPTTWAANMDGFCNLALTNTTTGVCVPMNEYVNYSAPMMLESVMPSITAAQLPLFDVDAATPVIEEQTLQLYMDYEENVWVDPITGNVLDQNFSILVTIEFPWGTESVAQSIEVAYTDAQKLASSASRWQTEFAYTYLPGSPLRADNANFTIMTLKGGYSDSEKSDAKNTIEDTSAALSSARTIPMALIGVALASLMGGFYV